jgi:hypothetical protein
MSPDLQRYQLAISKGKTKWLQEYLSENLPDLNLSSANYQAWFEDFIQTLESKNLSQPSQQKNYLTDVRNAIKVLDPNHPALEVIKFSPETWVEINEADRDRIAERSTKLINNPDAIVNKAIELVKTNNWSDIAAGLAVLTGRRCGEIIKTAQFEYKTQYSVTFKGALKRRNEAIDLVFEIPVLCQADLVIKAIASLRLQLGEQIKFLSITEINQRYEERVAKKCDRYFSALVPTRDGKDNLYSHLFRAVYATIACFWYCPSSVPEMEYRAAIQGHYKLLNEPDDKLRRSLAASRHYFDYKIADGLGNIDGRLGIKLGLSGVKVIEQFQLHDRNLDSPKGYTFEYRFMSVKPPTALSRNSTNILKSSPKPKRTMNELIEPTVSHQLSLPRLERISKLLNLSQSETINILVDWAEAGVILAQHLGIDNLTPEALVEHVKELEQVSNNPQSQPLQPQVSSEEHKRLILSVSSLSNSVEFLTKTLLEQKSYPNFGNKSDLSPIKTNPSSVESSNLRNSQPLGGERATENSSQANPKNPTTNNSRVNKRLVSAETRERDTPEVMTKDINNAIDAIMRFNDAEGRPHHQKFRLSIMSIRDLTDRAKGSISKVLKDRNEEIEAHHERHQLSGYHNKSRKDEKGNFYPPIESEPEIDYQKYTEIAA